MSMFEGFTDNLVFRVAIVVSIKVVVQVSARFTNSIFALNCVCAHRRNSANRIAFHFDLKIQLVIC